MSQRKVHGVYNYAQKQTICGRRSVSVMLNTLVIPSTEITCKSCLSGGASNTPAQVAAKVRNFRIKRLRGMYAAAIALFDLETATGLSRSHLVRTAIDDELSVLGAEPEGARRKRQRDELRQKYEENLN